MTRAVLIVLDSFGIGGAPDADRFGDFGSNTLLHIAEACAQGRADREGLRSGPLSLPNLDRLGLGAAARLACGELPPGLAGSQSTGWWGAASEVSNGKDTPSGHWEIAGVPVLFDWGYFPQEEPCFPETLIADFVSEAQLPGILGNRHASGTQIIEELGLEHMRSGKPICYTSSDSVFQIAAHEESFGLDRLYRICEIARRLVDPLNIGRVIARPFLGSDPDAFQRTGNRRDYSVPPPAPTLLDRVVANGGQVHAVGKIGDIFAHQGVSRVLKASGNAAVHATTLAAIREAEAGDLVFANYVDFDMLYGHRRDPAGYAAALEAFDSGILELESALEPGDLMILTADHGCDPTWPGTDHTRERVPVLIVNGQPARIERFGLRSSFCDIADLISAHLGLPGES